MIKTLRERKRPVQIQLNNRNHSPCLHPNKFPVSFFLLSDVVKKRINNTVQLKTQVG